MATVRDPWLDNTKLILVTLVVTGHAWTLLPGTLLTSWPYDFLYTWHIPAFVVVTGYLSRSFRWTRKRMWALVRTVAVPYVLFELALAWFRVSVGGENLERLVLNPHWPMWYLAAMFMWRLITPILLYPPAWLTLVGSVLISLTAGVWAGETLDISRTLGLLPFFVIGLRTDAKQLDWLRRPNSWWIGLVGFSVIGWFTWELDRWFPTEWLYYRRTYAMLDADLLQGSLIRLVLLALGVMGTVAVLSLIPRGTTWFTPLGKATLEVYLFHPFVVLAASYAGYEAWAAGHLGWAMVLTPIAAVSLALFLASPPVASVLNRAVDPFGALERRKQR
ncbi:MAG TPA: acyltransferase family protein [Marmoricola sp.]|nr:acyltransferase family protein [Marmoricola sp.]HNI70462.1 acyltransferase family protein [Marmoricola sp.]HNO39944.1 acyltransferase family protein [Marmoricola sp.]